MGGQGAVSPRQSNWAEIPAVLPDNGLEPKETAVFVNGILTDVALQQQNMQALANTGRRVIGIHNATGGLVRDLAQCLGDKLDASCANNGAVDTLAGFIAQAVDHPNPPHIIGHSQGGLVLSRAVSQAKQHLVSQGCTASQAEEKLGRLNLTTLGGASWTFEKGPKYHHVVNQWDSVPMGFGKGLTSDADTHCFRAQSWPKGLPPISDGIVNYAARAVEKWTHGCEEYYFAQIPPKTAP